MLKTLLLFLLAYIVIRLVSFWRKIGRTVSPPRPDSPALSGHMVKDEVCQTYLPRESARREVIDGEERFFCSEECRRKALDGRAGK